MGEGLRKERAEEKCPGIVLHSGGLTFKKARPNPSSAKMVGLTDRQSAVLNWREEKPLEFQQN